MELVEKVREVDEQRGNDDLNVQQVTAALDDVSFGESAYVPWRGRTIDRLTMRLERLARQAPADHGENEEESNNDNI